ncbi:MAG: hypothetical protein U5J95_11390 [Balneolaceae bacterium]|nr:hypothetical protein [Balneolaceae bacterium]
MSYFLKTLSKNQIKHLIKKSIDKYLGKEFDYTVKHFNTPNVNTTGDRLSFKVEVSRKESKEDVNN